MHMNDFFYIYKLVQVAFCCSGGSTHTQAVCITVSNFEGREGAFGCVTLCVDA